MLVVDAILFPNGNKIGSVNEIGNLVRLRRKSMGLSQKEAAGLCGVGIRFLSDLENGKTTLQLEKTILVLLNFGLELYIKDKDVLSL